MAIRGINGFAARSVLAGLSLIFSFVLSNANANDHWDGDDDPISTVEVRTILGGMAALPCDITPFTRDGTLSMVFWFRNNSIKPIFNMDIRGKSFDQAKNWTDDSIKPRARFDVHSKPAIFHLKDVQINDEGIYRCRVDFKYSPTRNYQINLTVIYPPHELIMYDSSGRTIQGTEVGPYQVGAEFSLTCEARGGKPRPTITWFINGAEGRGIDYLEPNTVVSKLNASQLRREHLNTTYKCQAITDNLEPLEKMIRLNVYLEPVSVKIIEKPDLLEANRSYELKCEVMGSHPRALIRWFLDDLKLINGKVRDAGNATVALSFLKFSPSYEYNGKTIKCRGENVAIGKSFREDLYHLNVIFPPRVDLQLGSTLKAENIKEGDDVYFECKVLANPAHLKITWRHDGQIITHNRTSGVIMSTQSLVLQKIRRGNGGNYTCVASNDQGETPSSVVNLRVKFSPVCKTKEVTIIGASLDESVKVRCEVEADPSDVDFFWEFNNSGENFEIAPAKFDGNNGTVSEFVYTPLNERDYGALTCWGRNSIGKQEAPCVYTVIPAVKPSPLNNCTIKSSANQSTEMLEVECAAGYDGGLKQEFRLEAYEVRTNNLRVNVTSANPDAPLFRVPVNELLPATHFYLTAYAVNAKGRSEVSLLEDITLRDSGKPSDSGINVIPLILLLIGCLMVLGITVLSVMLMMYRRRGATSPVHVEPYMKQPIISPPDSRNNSMIDVTHGDHTYFVEYTLKQVADYALNNQPDIIQSPQDQEKIKREPQLFLPVRPDTLFAPYDIHKQGLHTNRCSLNPFSAKSWEPISFKTDRNLMKELIIANSIPGPESCV